MLAPAKPKKMQEPTNNTTTTMATTTTTTTYLKTGKLAHLPPHQPNGKSGTSWAGCNESQNCRAEIPRR